jgi:tRNA threonylcarbamoyladenosine biosynthesis protein TsaE
LKLISRSPRETEAIATALGPLALAGDWLALDGELGAGKTLLTAAFCEAMGVTRGATDSPSFVLLNEYAGRLPIFHFDAYRLAGEEDELAEAGLFDERLGEGVVVVEWAERIARFLPRTALRVDLLISGPESRDIVVRDPGLRVSRALAPWCVE